MKIIIIIAGVIVTLILLGWLGLQIKPPAFPAYGAQPGVVKTIPLQTGLPTPVERFYRTTYGDNIPVITSAVLTGRGGMAPLGFMLPMRVRFIYETGKDYRAIIHATFFTLPVMKVNETYIDGHARGEMPYGIDEGEWYNDAMNVRVYCELLNWFPAALLTDPRVRWDPLDENTAVLVVPFQEKQQYVVVRFNPQTGKVDYFEAMKYRDANHKVLWINGAWFDQGKAWLSINIEEMLFNVPVQKAIRGES